MKRLHLFLILLLSVILVLSSCDAAVTSQTSYDSSHSETESVTSNATSIEQAPDEDAMNPFSDLGNPPYLLFTHPKLSNLNQIVNQDLIVRFMAMLKACRFYELRTELWESLSFDHATPVCHPDSPYCYYFDAEESYLLIADGSFKPIALYQIVGFDQALYQEALTTAQGFPSNFEEQTSQNRKS